MCFKFKKSLRHHKFCYSYDLLVTELRVVQFAYRWLNKWNSRYAVVRFCNHPYDYRPNWTPLCILNSQWSVRYRVTLGAAVCKYREFAVKTEISKSFISQSEKTLWWNIFENDNQSFQRIFIFEKTAKKWNAASRRSKTFEFYHFQSPREERRLKETSSSLAGK